MMFNDGIVKIKEIINKNLIGKEIHKLSCRTVFTRLASMGKERSLCLGKDSNGCKELVPFELTWLSNFLVIQFLNSVNKKLSKLPINLMM